MARAYLALGSNLGDRRDQLRAAIVGLGARGAPVVRASSLYESAPMYVLDQPAFLNAVVEAETDLSPEELLSAAKAIERELGRQPRVRNGPRELDIDVLLYGDERRDTPELALPHPRMHERPFVVVPLGELQGETARDAPGLALVEGPAWAGDLVDTHG